MRAVQTWVLVVATALAPAARAEVGAAPSPVAAPAPTPSPSATSSAAPSPSPTPRLRPLRRAVAIGAAVVPGLVIRGSGSFVAREGRTGARLALVGGIGLAAMIIGGVPAGLSGGSEKIVIPAVPLIVAGSGVLLSSWFADVWSAAGGARAAGVARAPTPWSIELGTTWLRDAHRERAFVRGAGRIVRGRVELGLGGLLDAENVAVEGELGVRVRLLGPPATGQRVADRSGLAVRATGRARRDDEDRVSVVTGELVLAGRLDLVRIDRALAGTFSELWTGLGVERASYPADRHDVGALLLGGFAWGAYLGARGEAQLFYDHRRDHLAGGLAAGRAAGFLGSFGASADVRIAGPWAVRGVLELGNAWVATLAVRYQGGAR